MHLSHDARFSITPQYIADFCVWLLLEKEREIRLPAGSTGCADYSRPYIASTACKHLLHDKFVHLLSMLHLISFFLLASGLSFRSTCAGHSSVNDQCGVREN